jgi:hypothetical protein
VGQRLLDLAIDLWLARERRRRRLAQRQPRRAPVPPSHPRRAIRLRD